MRLQLLLCTTQQQLHSAGGAKYYGPCPPSGTHHYRFTVYALSEATALPGLFAR